MDPDNDEDTKEEDTNVTQEEQQQAEPEEPEKADVAADERGVVKTGKLVIILVIAIVAGGLGYWGYTQYGPLPLTTYENTDLGFSIKSPKGFEVDDSSGVAVTFLEDDENEETQSAVSVQRDTASGVGKEEFLTAVEQIGESTLNQVADTNQEFKLDKQERRNINGNDAVYYRGTVKENGETVGTLTAVYIYVDENTVYTIIVGAHNGDARFGRASEQIVNSFTVK